MRSLGYAGISSALRQLMPQGSLRGPPPGGAGLPPQLPPASPLQARQLAQPDQPAVNSAEVGFSVPLHARTAASWTCDATYLQSQGAFCNRAGCKAVSWQALLHAAWGQVQGLGPYHCSSCMSCELLVPCQAGDCQTAVPLCPPIVVWSLA